MHRTHTCGELTAKQIGQQVTLAGRVHNLRDMGGLLFLDLRDRYGVTQASYDIGQGDKEISQLLESFRHEDVVQLKGSVTARPEGQTNDAMATGEIEIAIESVKVLTRSRVLPFAIVDDPATSEEQRFRHRYLDLRRRPVIENIIFRAEMNQFTRNWFADKGFLEVQTPLFTVSSPEGARDYLIPSRVNPGQFYALPQAPQQYKQLLMVGGVDKYFQIAPCFRDEDPRADRHSCEFYQIDAEMSFVEQEDVFEICESFVHELCAKLVPDKEISVDFLRLPYQEAIEKYGTDKPDLRFGMAFVDVSSHFVDSKFGVFANTIAQGGVVKAVKLGGKVMSRKEIDAVTDQAKSVGAKGLAYLIFEDGEVRSPIAKFLSEHEIEMVKQDLDVTDGDMVFFGAGEREHVGKVLDHVRRYLRDQYRLATDDTLAFVWVTDFPLYEKDPSTGEIDFGHNPFSMVAGGVKALETQDPLEIMSEQYDLVCNGYEILSGSIRNHDPEVLVKAFELVGKGEAEVKEKFGAIYEAFQYGCPPHGGFAFGFDRLMMILCDEPNIRECYAFPKSGKAEDVMMGAPSQVDEDQLAELSMQLIEPD